jgi:hypothetical protein
MTAPAAVLSAIEFGTTISGLTMTDFVAALDSLSAASLSPSSSTLWTGVAATGVNSVIRHFPDGRPSRPSRQAIYCQNVPGCNGEATGGVVGDR